ncbi:unnamed protein product [Citrullus colocynthis]|uniref:Uncharacterized protein n=1 Tax=Citrullus colocynthis TaxID=252529 RepID=A0ABP0ZB22_9ROSI
MAKLEDYYLKSQACFFLFFLVLLLFVVPHRCSTVSSTLSHAPSNSMVMSKQPLLKSRPFPSKRTLLLQQFEAAMHEVPSGPNPTSNKKDPKAIHVLKKKIIKLKSSIKRLFFKT